MIKQTDPSTLPAPKRILIVKPSSLGDVVSATPLLRALRNRFPQAHIAWLVGKQCADIIAHDSQLDEVIIFDRKSAGRMWKSPVEVKRFFSFLKMLRKEKFDWVIDLQGLLRSGFFTFVSGAKLKAGFADAREGANFLYNFRITPHSLHTVDRNIELCRALGVECEPGDLRLEVSEESRQFAKDFLKDNAIEPFGYLVCVIPTRWKTKQYPSRHFRTVLASLCRKLPCVVMGAPGDVEFVRTVTDGFDKNVIDLTGKTAVSQMVAMIANSAGVLCCDSAAALIAPAVGVDCVEIMGPTRVKKTGPYRGRSVTPDIPCKGCLRRSCPHITCMQIISPQTVITEVEKMVS